MSSDFSMWSEDEELIDPAGNLNTKARSEDFQLQVNLVNHRDFPCVFSDVVGFFLEKFATRSFWHLPMLLALGSAATLWKFVGTSFLA